jgi:hypothetical protein
MFPQLLTFRVIVRHISQIRVVEREMQEYQENEDAKEKANNMDVEEQPPTSLLVDADQHTAVPAASNSIDDAGF